MFNYPKSFWFVGKRNKGQLFITLPQVLLILVVIALLVYTMSACLKFTKRSSSLTALEKQLLRLQAKFREPSAIDPDIERQQMEILHNKLKTCNDTEQISGNADLKQLFKTNCLSINTVMKNADLENRTGWIKLNQVMLDFDDLYFQ